MELKIEKVKSLNGNEVFFCPARGGIITSLKFGGQEILYFDDETFKNLDENVRGGIPILFPNAGLIPDDIKPAKMKNLKQHGFARNLSWDYENKINGFKEILKSGLVTKDVYPNDFELVLEGRFEENNSFSLIQTIQNMGEVDMPVSSGFHPYFKVPSQKKKDIKFNFNGGKFVEQQIEKWGNGEFVSIDNPNSPLEVKIPSLGTLILSISKEYQKIWVWSQEGKDFICIEPVMRDKGGIVIDPELIKPKETLTATYNITFKN
jgi:galactose mutarotase-like enzyme